MAENKITFNVELTGNANEKVKNLGVAISDLEGDAKKSFAGSGRAFDVFKGSLASGLAQKAISSITDTARKLFDVFVTQGVQAAQVQEDAINELNSALRASGSFTVAASKDFQDFASQLQSVSKVGDETILSQLALAKSFGVSNQQAKTLVKAGLELSVAANLNLTEAVRRVGRSISGSTADVAKFAPEIANLTKEELAAGKAADVLIKRFGGLAAAQTQTFSGSVAQLSNSFGDLQESTGFSVTQNGALIAITKEVNKIINEFNTVITGSSEDIKSFVTDGIILAIESVQGLIAAFDLVARAVQTAFAPAKFVIDEFLIAIVAAQLAMEGKFAQAVDFIGSESKRAFGEAKDSINDAFFGDSSLEKVSELLNRIKNAAKESGEVVADTMAEAAIQTRDLAAATEELSKKRVQAAEKIAIQIQSVKSLEKAQTQQTQALNDALSKELITQKEHAGAIEKLNKDTNNKVIKGLFQRNDVIIKDINKQNANELQSNKDKLETILADEKLTAEQRMIVSKRVSDFEIELNNKRLQGTKSTLGSLTTLSRSKNKELFAIGKAASIALATINIAEAITKAFATFGPFGFIPAAAIAVAGAVQIGTIASQGLQKGIDSVPGSGTQDSFPALLAPGERVVPATSNQDLTQFLAESRGGTAILSEISNKLDRLSNQIIVNVGGEEIFNEIRRGLEDGRVLVPR